jgi:L-ascorbate metabolism protein UlaG (beta-lactamase superfamily)
LETQSRFETDIFPTSMGNLSIIFLGHGSLMLDYIGTNINVDPFGKVADYSLLPKADLILVTHDHHDHFDLQALSMIRDAKTRLVLTENCAQQVEGGIVLRNGEEQMIAGISIKSIPAYNQVNLRTSGEPYHPKGSGNGYILSLGGIHLYIGGDTENVPEMKALKEIDIAFLPMNLPYTMSPEMVADAAIAFQPHILYPYHYGGTDPTLLLELLKNEPGIDVRIRKMS